MKSPRSTPRPSLPLMAATANNATASGAQPAGQAAEERTLPFAFAKRHGVLIQEFRDGVAHAIYRQGAALASLAEVRRFAAGPVSFVPVDSQTFDSRLQVAYESGAAMTMVEGLDDETDLLAVAQQLPEPSDLTRQRRRGADHSFDQCTAHASHQGQCL